MQNGPACRVGVPKRPPQPACQKSGAEHFTIFTAGHMRISRDSNNTRTVSGQLSPLTRDTRLPSISLANVLSNSSFNNGSMPVSLSPNLSKGLSYDVDTTATVENMDMIKQVSVRIKESAVKKCMVRRSCPHLPTVDPTTASRGCEAARLEAEGVQPSLRRSKTLAGAASMRNDDVSSSTSETAKTEKGS